MSNRDVVLFLGAGFSHDADLPLLSNFGLKAPLSEFELQNKDGPFEREMAAAARTYESFRDALVDRGALTGDAVQNVEAAFCIAEALKEAILKYRDDLKWIVGFIQYATPIMETTRQWGREIPRNQAKIAGLAPTL